MERKRAIARRESCFHVLPENLKTLIAQNDKLRSNTSFRWARNIDGTRHAGIDMRRDVEASQIQSLRDTKRKTAHQGKATASLRPQYAFRRNENLLRNATPIPPFGSIFAWIAHEVSIPKPSLLERSTSVVLRRLRVANRHSPFEHVTPG